MLILGCFRIFLLFKFFQIYEGCLNNINADIVFTLDESSSANSASSYGGFSDVLDAVSEAVGRLNIDSSRNINVGVSAIHNVSYVRTVFNLGDYSDLSSLQSAVKSTDYGGLWGTDMALGLYYSCFQMFGGSGDRSWARNYLIYITHGWTNTTVAPSIAQACKDAGITVGIFAIDSSADSLSSMVSSGHFVNTNFRDGCIPGDMSRLTYEMTDCQWYCDSGSGLVLGGNPSTSSIENVGNSGYTYIFKSPAAQFQCCGRIHTWEFVAHNSGTLTLQVWKPTSSTTYMLTGTNTVYIPSSAVGHVHTYIVPNNERITVNKGDFFGWHSSDKNIIPYHSTGSSQDQVMYVSSGSNIVPGMTVSFGSSVTQFYRKHAVRVTLENDDSSFWFPESGYSVTVFDHEGAGTSIFQWSAVQKDQEFLTYGILVDPKSSESSFAYYHSQGEVTGEVQLTRNLNNGQSYQLTFEAVDTCTHCGRGTLGVSVKNLPPRILSLPSYYEIHEDADRSSHIDMHTIVFADDSGDTVTCSKDGVTPSSANSWFQVLNSGGTSAIRLKKTAAIDFDSTPEVRLRVKCSDGKDYDREYFKLFLRRNVPPSVTNMFTQIDLVAGGHGSGSSLVTPVASDDDSTSFTYDISYCGSPPVSNTCPAQLISASTGALQTNMTLSSFTNGGFNIRLNISDGQTETGPYPLSVRVYDLNDSPVIFNLPLPETITITEAIPPFTWLYTVQYYDINNWNTLTLTTSISPAEGTEYFEITKTLHDQDTVKTSSKQINYETLSSNTFTVKFVLSDGRLSTSTTLTITIQNENEGFSFLAGSYTVAADEGPVDTIVGDPGFEVTHIDNENDNIQFSFDCGTNSRYFKMDKLSGLVSFAWNMDVDKGYTKQSVCNVTAWDSGYLTATTKLTITIYDINDNAPRFDKRYYTYWTTALTPPETVLGIITITDSDITHPHNFIERVWIVNQPNDIQYFDRNATNGAFFINQNLSSIGDGSVIEMTIYAEDYGHLKSSAKITVILPSETTTTSTTTTDLPLDVFDDAATTVWVSIASIAAVIFMTLAFYMSCKYASSGGRSPDNQDLPRKNKGRGRDIVFRDSGIC